MGWFCHQQTNRRLGLSRIAGKTFGPRQYYAILTAIQAKVHPFEAGFKLVGDTREELAFMVITRSERLKDYTKNSPVPQFEEEEKEAMARPFLEREGVTDYIFKTIHVGI